MELFMKKLAICIVGPDQPGIIAKISKFFVEERANIEQVAQTSLDDLFSCTYIVSVPEDITPLRLQEKMNQTVSSLSLSVVVQPYHPSLSPVTTPSQPFVVTAWGPDKKGLVAGVTEVFAQWQVNVTNLRAVFKGGNNPDENIMLYEVEIPASIEFSLVQKALKDRAYELGIDIRLQHQDIFYHINRI